MDANRKIDRRKAVLALGSVSLGTLLAACGGDDEPSAVTTTSVPTTDGGTATVEPQTATGSGATELFDDSSSCVLSAEQTEGPYYFDVDSIRSDVREGREGVPLRLALRVRDAAGCTPLENAVVDIWHCDAGGVYSGFEAASRGTGGGSGRTDEETYLRGAQVANADGIVEFTTVYPGWYRGRTVHIHAKVHVDNANVLTTQFFFDEAVTAEVYDREPYAGRGAPDTSNASDGIFDESLLLRLSPDGDGYLGAISLDVRSA
jgi:protocatechuate 3,4-dioxygenase beta subunit